jgi:hypothetical protein
VTVLLTLSSPLYSLPVICGSGKGGGVGISNKLTEAIRVVFPFVIQNFDKTEGPQCLSKTP